MERQPVVEERFVPAAVNPLSYFATYRRQLIQYAAFGLGLLVLSGAITAYRTYQRNVRQDLLQEAMHAQNAQIGNAPNEFVVAYPTQEAKDKEVARLFTWLSTDYRGTDEGNIAEYYLGTTAADKGKLPEAEQHLKTAADAGNKEYASQAKLALAQVYNGEGKLGDAQRVLQDLMNNPTTLVSKQQATLMLAEMLTPTKPDEARKLLEPLRAEPGIASRTALTALNDLPRK